VKHIEKRKANKVELGFEVGSIFVALFFSSLVRVTQEPNQLKSFGSVTVNHQANESC
jgi:hypothetical protein